MTDTRLFDIMGSIGAPHVYDLHPVHPVLAYETGCYITLWDLEMDKKLMIHPHDHAVTCVKFFGPNFEYLLSIDSNYNPSIYITEWQTMTRLHQMYLPVHKSNPTVISFDCTYSQKDDLLILVTNYKDHYSFSIWSFKLDSLTLLANNKEDNQELCVGLRILEDRHNTLFAVAERRTLKYWKYEEQRLQLSHRIHTKEDIIDIGVSYLTQFILFITKQGTLCIVNKEGHYISSLKHPTLAYTCLDLYSDYLFLGTKEGEIDIYQLSSMKFIKSLKNISNAVNATRNIQHTDNETLKSFYKLKTEPRPRNLKNLIKIQVAKNTGFLALKYNDNNVFIYDIDKDKVLSFVSGHSRKVQEIVWDKQTKKTFGTCSSDGTIRMWSFVGDRWESYAITPPITVPTLGDISYQNQRQSLGTKETSYMITCMQIDWITREIYTGDNQGYLNVYDLNTKESKISVKVGGFKLREVALGKNFVGIAFANGNCVIIERQRSFDTYIKLEEPGMEMGTKRKIATGIKFIEKNDSKLDKFQKESPVLLQNRYGMSYKDEMYSGSEFRSSMQEVSQKAITVNGASSLRLHQVILSHGYLNGIVLANYYIIGRVVDFTVHASNDYLFVLSNEDIVYIFQIATGEIKGRIEVPRLTNRLILDPAGLYLLVASPYIPPDFQSEKQSRTLRTTTKGFGSPIQDKGFIDRNINTDQSVLTLFEIWTGEYVGQLNRIQTVSSLAFSYEGSHLTVGSSKGIVTVLSLDEGIRENIYAALDGMQQNPYFWTDFQLDVGDKTLPNEASYDQQLETQNASNLTEKEVQVSFDDGSRYPIRPPQNYPSSFSKNLKETSKSSSKIGTPGNEKIPTMKNYVANKKLQTSFSQPQKAAANAMLLSGGNDLKISSKQPSSQTSKFDLPHASVHQEKAKEYVEYVRATNFGRKDNEEKKDNLGREKGYATKLFKDKEQQTFPQLKGPMDKIIDLVIDLDDNDNRSEASSRFQYKPEARQIQPDPEDIDDVYQQEEYRYRNDIGGEEKLMNILENQTISSSRNEDISNMYDEINEFERKFFRNDNA